MFDWEDLRHFLAVAQAGSLSGAARRLKVDHATVSRRLAALEAALQATLVERLPRSCRLTAVGEQVLDHAAQIEAGAFAIERTARGAQTQLQGKVVVSAPPVLAVHFLAKQVLTFQQRYPQLRLSIVSQVQQASLDRREADIAVRLLRPTQNSYVARRLGVMPYAMYASRDYAFRDEPSAWGFIAYDPDYNEMPHQRWLHAAAGPRPIVCEVSDITSQQVAARTGIGVANLPCFMGDHDPELVRLPFQGEGFSREIWLVLHAEMKRTQPIRAVADFIAEAFSRSNIIGT